jgi:phage terminase small subunit
MSKLTPKQEMFCKEYLINFNATQAAVKAGYSKKTAQTIGAENLTKPIIRDYLQKAINERTEKLGIDADWVLAQAVLIQQRCMQVEPVMEVVDGQKVKSGEFKFDATNAIKALDTVGKHVNIKAFDNTVDLKGQLNVTGVLLTPASPGSIKKWEEKNK